MAVGNAAKGAIASLVRSTFGQQVLTDVNAPGEYDLAGFMVGMARRDELLVGELVRAIAGATVVGEVESRRDGDPAVRVER